MVRFLLFFFLACNVHLAQAKHPKESQQQILNRVSENTDTIFIGRKLRAMSIKDGLVYADGDTYPIGIIEVEVLKVYRGKININDKLLLCMRYFEYEASFDNSNLHDSLFFGLQVANNIVLIPDTYGYTMKIPENISILQKALGLKRKNLNIDPYEEVFSKNKIVRNACKEPMTWPTR